MEHEKHPPPNEADATGDDPMDTFVIGPSESPQSEPAAPGGKASATVSTEALYGPSENPSNFRVKGWRENPNFFTSVCFSTTAVMEMAIHAKQGDQLEVMGMLMGKIVRSTFHVLNVFPLPVEGTETRVNAQSQANEYIINFLETQRASGVTDYCVGWYHSHPGYGCWLSGIDVGTQSINQQYQDPFLAVVIDPHETIATGKVSIGGFRTYPEGTSAGNGGPRAREAGNIPLEKVEDYGVHADRYYEVKSSFFKTEADEFALEVIRADRWADILSQSARERAKKEEIIKQEIVQLASKVRRVTEARIREKKSDGETSAAEKVPTISSLVPRSDQISAMSFNDSLTQVVNNMLFL
jgi:COP9 signalosome complex subunit 5